MNVLIVSPYYSTHRGGVEIVAGNLARLFSQSHAVSWAASDCDAVPESLGTITIVPMRSWNIFERWFGIPFPLWSLGSCMRLGKEVQRADVIHVHDGIAVGAWLISAWSALLGKPMIVTQHVGFIPYSSRLLRGAQMIMHRVAALLILGRAARVVFVSSVVAGYFQQFVTFRHPPVLIANGIDTERFTLADEMSWAQSRAALCINPGDSVLLFVGRFVEKKGLRILRELVPKLADVTWVFVGWGALNPSAWRFPNTKVYERLNVDALVPLYQAADLLVLPSIGEGLPLVAQESMACGTPILTGEDTATAIGAPGDLVYSCAVGGSEAVARWTLTIRRTLREVAQDRADLRSRAARFARERWSWKTCADRYMTLLSEVNRATLTVSSSQTG